MLNKNLLKIDVNVDGTATVYVLIDGKKNVIKHSSSFTQAKAYIRELEQFSHRSDFLQLHIKEMLFQEEKLKIEIDKSFKVRSFYEKILKDIQLATTCDKENE